jgi:DNA-binding GntR family transcriptional regulator
MGTLYYFIKKKIGGEVSGTSREGQQDGTRPARLSAVTTVQHATLLALREAIAAGRYEPGQPLRQETLARDFGVSVPPVREALKTLETEGQVVYVPRRGYSVSRLSRAELRETYRIRDLLETEAITRAVGGLTGDDLARMRAAVRDMDRADRVSDVAALTAANRRFHFTVFDAAAMPRMADMIRMLWDGTDHYRSRYFASPANRDRVRAEHAEILRAVARGDGETAAELSRQHRDHALEALCDTLPAEEETEAAPPGTPAKTARRASRH